MLEQLNSNNFNKILTVVIFLILSLATQGCLQARSRVRIDIPNVEINPKIGGPYYVVDITGEFHTSRKIKSSETLHNECEKKYPNLFSKSKNAIPIIVSRNAKTINHDNPSLLSMLFFSFSLFATPCSEKSRIEENISLEIGKGTLKKMQFFSEVDVFHHGWLTYPFDSFVCPKSSGWRKQDSFEWKSPKNVVGQDRWSAYADAIVSILSSMSETERNTLFENKDAWARYYQVRPYILGKDIVSHKGKVVHKMQIERPTTESRIPIVKSFFYDVNKYKGKIICDFSGCNSMFAQQWVLYQLLNVKLQEVTNLPGERSILIGNEEISSEGVYSLTFSVVE